MPSQIIDSSKLEWMRFSWDILWSVGTLVAIVISLWVKRSSANSDRVTQVEERLHQRLDAQNQSNERRDSDAQAASWGMSNRVGRIEETLKHMPTVSDIRGIHEGLTGLANQVAELRGAQTGTTRMVERMNEYLMEREK